MNLLDIDLSHPISVEVLGDVGWMAQRAYSGNLTIDKLEMMEDVPIKMRPDLDTVLISLIDMRDAEGLWTGDEVAGLMHLQLQLSVWEALLLFRLTGDPEARMTPVPLGEWRYSTLSMGYGSLNNGYQHEDDETRTHHIFRSAFTPESWKVSAGRSAIHLATFNHLMRKKIEIRISSIPLTISEDCREILEQFLPTFQEIS